MATWPQQGPAFHSPCFQAAVPADADALKQLQSAYTESVTMLKYMAEGSQNYRWWVALRALQCLGEWPD